MDINYIVLLDCSVDEIIKIRLSEEEKIDLKTMKISVSSWKLWKTSTDSIWAIAFG